MGKLLTTRAFNALQENQFHTARKLYNLASSYMGENIFQTNIEVCDRREAEQFLHWSRQSHARVDEPLINYCVSVMNGKQYARRALSHNLEVLAKFRSARLVVNLPCDNDGLFHWISRQFYEQLESVLLVVNCIPLFKCWRKSEVKNSFQPFLKEGYYSFLGSDAYLSRDQVIKTKQAIKEFGNCLIHYYSGNLQDGTIAHIALPIDLYKSAGYANKVSSEQFGDLSLIMNAIALRKNLKVITLSGVNILRESTHLREFIAFNGLKVDPIEYDLGSNQKLESIYGELYPRTVQMLDLFDELNGYFSAYQNSQTELARRYFAKRLSRIQCRAKQSMNFQELARKTLSVLHGRAELSSNATVYYAVVESYENSQLKWIKKLCERSRGHVVLVDAAYPQRLGDYISDGCITVISPKVGDVPTFKEFWISCAKVLVKPEGSPTGSVSTGHFYE